MTFVRRGNNFLDVWIRPHAEAPAGPIAVVAESVGEEQGGSDHAKDEALEDVQSEEFGYHPVRVPKCPQLPSAQEVESHNAAEVVVLCVRQDTGKNRRHTLRDTTRVQSQRFL